MEKLDKTKKIIMGIGLVLVVALMFLYLNFFRTFTVTFEAKIGAGIQAQEVKVGNLATKPQDPVADGYVFEGWYLNDQEYDFNKPVEKNITLTAKWNKVEEYEY